MLKSGSLLSKPAADFMLDLLFVQKIPFTCRSSRSSCRISLILIREPKGKVFDNDAIDDAREEAHHIFKSCSAIKSKGHNKTKECASKSSVSQSGIFEWKPDDKAHEQPIVP